MARRTWWPTPRARTCGTSRARRYIDLVQSYGAIILGHAHPAITAAVTQAAAGGTSYGAPTPGEMLLAEMMVARVPSCDMVRLMNSGTEATCTAVRLARGYTGRDRIVIFHGNFHGATDALLAAGGSGVATLGLPGTAGVPASAVANTHGRAVQRGAAARRAGGRRVRRAGGRQHGRGRPGARLPRGPARRVRPGRRAAGVRRGDHRLPPRAAVGRRRSTTCVADLTTFGKVIGGGLPIGSVGGRRDIMETLSPLGTVFHAGTLAGNPLATAAGRAALSELTPDVYMELSARARHLSALLRDACADADLPAQFPVVGTLVGMYFGDGDDAAPTSPEAKTTDEQLFAAFFHAMLREGVALAPGAYEALFVGLAHTDDVLDEIGERAARAAAAVMRDRP